MKNLMLFLFLLIGVSFSGEGFKLELDPNDPHMVTTPKYAKEHSAHHFDADFRIYNLSKQFRTLPVRTMFVEWNGTVQRDRYSRNLIKFQVTEFDPASGKTCWRKVTLDCKSRMGYLDYPHPVDYESRVSPLEGPEYRHVKGQSNLVRVYPPGEPRFHESYRMDVGGGAISFFDDEFPFNASLFCSDHP